MKYSTNDRWDVDEDEVFSYYEHVAHQGFTRAVQSTAETFSLAPETVQWIIDDQTGNHWD